MSGRDPNASLPLRPRALWRRRRDMRHRRLYSIQMHLYVSRTQDSPSLWEASRGGRSASLSSFNGPSYRCLLRIIEKLYHLLKKLFKIGSAYGIQFHFSGDIAAIPFDFEPLVGPRLFCSSRKVLQTSRHESGPKGDECGPRGAQRLTPCVCRRPAAESWRCVCGSAV